VIGHAQKRGTVVPALWLINIDVITAASNNRASILQFPSIYQKLIVNVLFKKSKIYL